MGHYVKFEVFLPTKYKDSRGSPIEVDSSEIRELGAALLEKFGGFTETNPVKAPPFRGWWKSKYGIDVDLLISMFVFVPQDQYDEALRFFEERKDSLEAKYYQQFVLITFSPIQVIGQL